MRKALGKIKPTPELLEVYRNIGLFLKRNPEIKAKKLVLGWEVNVSTIPDDKVEEWLEIIKFDYKTIDK